MTSGNDLISKKRQLIPMETLDFLGEDLRLLYNDFLLAAAGYRIHWAVDFSELFRYLHPALDLLTYSKCNQSKFFVRQLAIRFFLESSLDVHLILPPSMMEYNRELKKTAERSRRYVSKPLDDPMEHFLKRDRPFTELYKLIEDFPLIGSEDLSLKIRQAMIDAVKAKVIESEYEKGTNIYRKLIETGQLRVLSENQEEALEKDPNYERITGEILEFLNKLRPSRDLSNLFDAQNCAVLAILNRSELIKEKNAYFMITDASMVRRGEMVSDLLDPLPITEYGDRLPLLRSVNYCLLRAYFRSSPDDFGKLSERVRSLLTFVEGSKKILYDDNTLVDGSAKLEDRINILLNELSGLHAVGELYDRLSDQIQKEIGFKLEEFSFLKGSEFAEKFSKISSNPQNIFNIYLGLEQKVGQLGAEIMKVYGQANRLKWGGRERLPIYGVYPETRYTESERPISNELDSIFIKLASYGLTNDEIRKVTEDIELMLKAYSNSPALHVAHSICLRRQRRYADAESQLNHAETLFPNNQEAHFHRAILNRMMADRDETPTPERERLLEKAWSLSKTLIESKEPRPEYYQFHAYLIWRRIQNRNPRVLEGPREEDLKDLERAISLCRSPLDGSFGEDAISRHIYYALENDIAWYLALTGKSRYVAEAEKKMNAIPMDLLTPSWFDTFGFVHIQKFKLNPYPEKLGLLKQAIRYYGTALQKAPRSVTSKDGLAIAMQLYMQFGGKFD